MKGQHSESITCHSFPISAGFVVYIGIMFVRMRERRRRVIITDISIITTVIVVVVVVVVVVVIIINWLGEMIWVVGVNLVLLIKQLTSTEEE